MSAAGFPDFGTGRFEMRFRVYGIRKLARDKAVRRILCDFIRFVDGAFHSLRSVRQYDFRAVRF